MKPEYPHLRIHGGPDQAGVPAHDFSTNSNACGPSPHALAAVTQADPTQYPDAAYTDLRQQLAAFHKVDSRRIVLAASASEFIFRITSLVSQRGGKSVSLPTHSYGDYAHAASAFAMEVVREEVPAPLRWSCDPSSPLGVADERLQGIVGTQAAGVIVVLDRAYEPLRLEGALHLPDVLLQKTWQLWTPNKALGLTGVRASYAIAPLESDADVQAMDALCPSWPVGSHGVAMLQAWTQPDVQAWLAGSLHTLREWKARQIAICESLGWTVRPSRANFFVCHTGLDPVSMTASVRGLRIESAMTALRAHGIKLRDCASFGLPGHVRVSVQSPEAQAALHNAWQAITRKTA
ncbi:MAG: aminotransferase class I/II-fold pyridoxal phosphate-dependent enzyme [Pseudomonadota bacterium]